MKIFEIRGGICYRDVTEVHPTLESAERDCKDGAVFAEAPDCVFEGWGYDDSTDGDARFIKPTAPDGWCYDDATGTFGRTLSKIGGEKQ